MARVTSGAAAVLVIIPAHNEAKSIGQVVSGVRASARRLADADLDLRICVIDDGSTDDTAAAARRAGADHVLTHKQNLGCGAAVRSGLIHSREQGFNVTVKLDADGQHDPADIPALIRPILEDRADIVYGNRFPRITYRMPFLRRTGNALFTGLMRWLTHWDVKDSQPGMFAVNDVYLKVFFLPGDYNYTQQVLLDAYLKGMRFEQAPITFRRRKAGESFISLRYPFKVLPQILMLMVLVRPLKVFLPVAGLFLTAAAVTFLVELGLWFAGYTARPVENTNLVLGLAMFGLNAGFFGLIAELIVRRTS